MNMIAVILAAGVGSRLGRPMPKSLSVLPSGETILGRMISTLRTVGVSKIVVVVGFKAHVIMESHPDVYFRYNPFYYITNTSKSLLCAVEDLDEDVIWANGDVVCDRGVIEEVVDYPGNCVAVQRAKCDDEEVKYTVGESGAINAISKEVSRGLGEAVGVNKIVRRDLGLFTESLRRCRDEDYFEMGIEKILDGVQVWPVDVTRHRCIEVDFSADWERAKVMFAERKQAVA